MPIYTTCITIIPFHRWKILPLLQEIISLLYWIHSTYLYIPYMTDDDYNSDDHLLRCPLLVILVEPSSTHR